MAVVYNLTMDRKSKMYDSRSLAKFFGVSEETVCEWCKNGKLPAFKIGKKWRVRVEDLRKMIDRKVTSKKINSASGLF